MGGYFIISPGKEVMGDREKITTSVHYNVLFVRLIVSDINVMLLNR